MEAVDRGEEEEETATESQTLRLSLARLLWSVTALGRGERWRTRKNHNYVIHSRNLNVIYSSSGALTGTHAHDTNRGRSITSPYVSASSSSSSWICSSASIDTNDDIRLCTTPFALALDPQMGGYSGGGDAYRTAATASVGSAMTSVVSSPAGGSGTLGTIWTKVMTT